MRRRGALAAAVAGLLLAVPAGATAADPPPGAAMSDNLEYMTRVAGANGITEGKFDRVRGRDVLVITGRFGFKTYDISNPANPVLLDEFLPAGIAPGGYWQNEDMELDTRRKLIIGALDPRHNDADPSATGCPTADNDAVRDPDCSSGFFVISYSDPANMRQIGDLVSLPSGHTSTCIDDCRYIWTGGPARRSDQLWLGAHGTMPSAFGDRLVGDGRPIWVTDLTNPSRPVVSDQPIDLWRNDGWTDYSHDVDVDDQGIAWVAGRGGIRGYATEGRHRDPYQNRVRTASPFDPVLVAGGGVGGTAQTVMLMHNSGRPTDGSVRADGVKRGNVLVGTEEDFTRPCEQSGKIVLSELTDSWGGEGAASSTLQDPYRMRPIDTFHPQLDTPEGDTDSSQGCSAHYFEIEGPLLGAAWYGQGLRLLDIGDADNVRQVGYFRVTGTATDNPSSNSWDMGFFSTRRGGDDDDDDDDDDDRKGRKSSKKKSSKKSHRGDDYVFLFDMNRGVEVLKVKGGARTSSRMKSVVAPTQRKSRFSSRVIEGSSLGSGGFICPLFTRI
jgi:hypothetical protein